MATIWITIVEMGGNPSKMENAPKNKVANAANASRNNTANAPRNNVPKPNAPKPNAPKPNAPRNGANSPRLPEEEHEPNLEAGVGNVSVSGTVGNNKSRSPSNANSVEPEVAAFEVDPESSPPSTGGRRRSRKGRKSRKARRSKRSY